MGSSNLVNQPVKNSVHPLPLSLALGVVRLFVHCHLLDAQVATAAVNNLKICDCIDTVTNASLVWRLRMRPSVLFRDVVVP